MTLLTCPDIPKKIPLIGLTKEEMRSSLECFGLAPKEASMRVRQLWHWLYVRGVSDFSSMKNLSKAFLEILEECYTISYPSIVEEKISSDGTVKWLFRFLPDNSGKMAEVETVYIPEEDRGTLCISSQVGCTLNCSFCHTGTQRLQRNLTSEEIILQFLSANDRLNHHIHFSSDFTFQNRKITNIVMMGMGEPLYNFEAVKKALLIISDNEGISLSRRRITLSTSGIVPEIYRTGAEIGVMLAISLHAVTNELRNQLVPINKKYPIEDLLSACRNYPGLSNARRITFEYVMLKDINDSLEDAARLVSLLKNIPAKINLIPFNPWPGTIYECSCPKKIEIFANYLNNAGYSSPVRKPRGRDIFAACGQLKSTSENFRRKKIISL